jgi:hypothetical protein
MKASEIYKKLGEKIEKHGDQEVYFKEILLNEWSEIWNIEEWNLEKEKFFVITGGY